MATANKLRNELNDKLKEIDESSESNGLNLEILKSLNTKEQMKKKKNVTPQEKSGNISFSKHNNHKSQNVSPEINVIGMNVDEATFIIDKYIDDCVIAKLSPVRIVHGKGTGKLREGIHKYLKRNSQVKTFRLGTFGEVKWE